MSNPQTIILFLDPECVARMPFQDGKWTFDFGTLNDGEKRSKFFYIKNVTRSRLEEVQVVVYPPQVGKKTVDYVGVDWEPKENITIDREEVLPVTIRWETTTKAFVGPVTAEIEVYGYAVLD